MGRFFVVDPIAEYNMPQYLLREFKVTDARDGQSRTVRQFQFTDWPEQGVPKSGDGFIEFIGQVHKTKEQFGQEVPYPCTAVRVWAEPGGRGHLPDRALTQDSKASHGSDGRSIPILLSGGTRIPLFIRSNIS
ncbi:Uncharacterized protein FKW44_009465 [Caligus rogercresseyi]|uniref:Tyrosine-protein phosphatase domain-containing protein n=1 Tax=Caligus rogercresseyi TaxID=217165 RepID=A0A7T8K8C0_CALRO|nr:Uncharacterized protein FKW44_009465 [Caligus rogercresseyi]